MDQNQLMLWNNRDWLRVEGKGSVSDSYIVGTTCNAHAEVTEERVY